MINLKEYNYTFYDVVMRLKEDPSDITLYKYLYNINDKSNYIYNKYSILNERKKIKEIRSLSDINNVWKHISINDINSICNILNGSIYNIQKYFRLNKYSKLISLFNIYYYDFYNYKEEVLFDIKSNLYISHSININLYNIYKLKNIIRLSDLYNKYIPYDIYNTFLIYIKDCNRYQINDSLFESILSINDINIFLGYLKYNSYKEYSKVVNKSETYIRYKIYSYINELSNFFYFSDGIRVLNIMFSIRDNYLYINDIKNYFNKYYLIFIYLVCNNYIYNLKLINDMIINKN